MRNSNPLCSFVVVVTVVFHHPAFSCPIVIIVSCAEPLPEHLLLHLLLLLLVLIELEPFPSKPRRRHRHQVAAHPLQIALRYLQQILRHRYIRCTLLNRLHQRRCVSVIISPRALRMHKRDGCTFLPSPSCPPHSMHIVLQMIRAVIIHHKRQPFHIQATRRHRRRDQHRHIPFFEVSNR